MCLRSSDGVRDGWLVDEGMRMLATVSLLIFAVSFAQSFAVSCALGTNEPPPTLTGRFRTQVSHGRDRLVPPKEFLDDLPSPIELSLRSG